MAGSIVALGAIAAVLFTLDKNSARDFKQPQLAEHNKPAAPEVLSPHAGASSGPAPAIEPAVSDEKQPALRQAPSAGHNETVKTDTLTVQAASESIAKPVPPVKPRTETVQNKPKPAAQDGEGANKTTNTDVAADDVQPTAEQILNSGNLEKAREVAQREARERRARQAAAAREKAAQATTSANKHAAEEKPVSTAKPAPAEKTAAAEKPATTPKTAPASNKNTAAAESRPATAENASASGKASVQAGAYNNRQAADEQRAKLAAMGVQTKVVTVQSNGKTVYRVQTNQMNSTQANQIKQRLQSKGVDSITRNQ
ncbi:SPOR domain-containing protein [Kingella denitrificans]|nr:SPOR domain-containing protein [Kingella denitrificans]